MKIHLIINPSSGKESGARSGPELADILSARGDIVSRSYTEKKGDGTAFAIDAGKRGAELIVACGDDGTVNEVVHGMAQAEERLPIAIYAQGTVNDFATQLQLPLEAEAFADMIDRNKRMVLEVGRMNDRTFLNVAAFGEVSKIGHEVDVEAKTMLGRLAYVIEGIRTAPDLLNIPMPMRITMDTGEVAEGDFLFAGIANSRSVGGFSHFAPRALVNDGLLDLIIIQRTDVVTLGQILLRLRSGEHIEHEGIAYYQSSTFEVTAENETAIDLDGEEAGVLPAKVQVLPAHLPCIIP